MKNIIYNGNLENDMCDASLKFDFKEEFGISAICFGVAAAFIATILFKIGAIAFTLPSLLITVCISLGIDLFIATPINLIYRKRMINKKKQVANEKMNSLVKELEKNNVNVSKENLLDSEIDMDKNTTKSYDSKNKLTEKEQKIVKYFYLLDNSDKIKVLKEVNKIIKRKRTRSDVINLSLLEEEDLLNKELPVKKTLVMKKKH